MPVCVHFYRTHGLLAAHRCRSTLQVERQQKTGKGHNPFDLPAPKRSLMVRADEVGNVAMKSRSWAPGPGHFRSSRRRGNRCASDRFQGFSRHCSTAVQRGSFSKAVAQDLAALVVPMPDKCPQFEQPDSAAATSPAPLKRRCQDKLFACMLRSRISSNPGSRAPRAPPISASTQRRGELLAPMLA